MAEITRPMDLLRWDETHWHQPSVYAAGWLAAQIYKRDRELKEAAADLTERGFEFRGIHDDDADAGVWCDGRRAFIACRGSQMTKTDWLRNGAFYPVASDSTEGRVHYGFRKGMRILVPHICQAFADWEVPLNTLESIRLSGHSQGGALAQVVAEQLVTHHDAPVGRSMVYSFASPRVYTKSAEPQVPHIRVIHAADIVPMFPLPLFFRHHGELHIVYDDKTILNDVQTMQYMKIRARMLTKVAASGAVMRSLWWASILRAMFKGGKAHSMETRYLEALAP